LEFSLDVVSLSPLAKKGVKNYYKSGCKCFTSSAESVSLSVLKASIFPLGIFFWIFLITLAHNLIEQKLYFIRVIFAAIGDDGGYPGV
jgi:hypothetical protein